MKRITSFVLAGVLVATVFAGFSQAKSRVTRVHAAKTTAASAACPIAGCTGSCPLNGATTTTASKAPSAMKRGDCSDPSRCPAGCPRQGAAAASARLASR